MKTFLCVAISALLISGPVFADDVYSEIEEGVIDTTGEISFGFGLHSSPNSLVDWDNELTTDYWFDEGMAIGGAVAINRYSTAQGDTETSSTVFDLECLFTYVLIAGETTRLTIGAGLGFQYYSSDDGSDVTDEGSPYTITIPAQLSLEHFFTKTISVGLNAGFNLYRIEVDDDGNDDSDDQTRSWMNLDTTQVGIELTWYTD